MIGKLDIRVSLFVLALCCFWTTQSFAQGDTEIQVELVMINDITAGGGVRGLGGGDNLDNGGPGGQYVLQFAIEAKINAYELAEAWIYEEYLTRPENEHKIFVGIVQHVDENGIYFGNEIPQWVTGENVWEYWITGVDFYFLEF